MLARRASHPFFHRVRAAVRHEALIPKDSAVLIAVSGGPDSVALLAVLCELRDSGLIPGLRLEAAHVNYGLRGEQSEQDEDFVRALGERFQVPVWCLRARLAPKPGRSLQEHARAIRYAYFEQLCRQRELSAVVTGHTADDQAETVLMWLLRGSGTKGLAGMPRAREGRVIRPLLHLQRREVLDYLASRGLAYRTDASNSSRVYRRNRIRHELLPLLQSLNPRIVQTMARSADLLRADEAVLEELARDRWASVQSEAAPWRIVLDTSRLMAQPLGLRRRIVRRALALVGGEGASPPFHHVEAVLESIAAGRNGVTLRARGIEVRRQGQCVIVESTAETRKVERQAWETGVILCIPGELSLRDGRRIVAAEGRLDSATQPAGSRFIVDSDLVKGPLVLRSWRPGDWFCPAGLGGHRKKLQDFFVDYKVPRARRHQVPVVVAPEGIVWVVGHRGDERFRARQDTARPLTLALIDED